MQITARRVLAPALAAALTLAGCTSTATSRPHHSPTPPAPTPAPTTTPTETPAPLPTAPITGQITGVLPPSCHARQATNGRDLPDPTCTPGVVSDRVTQADIASTICLPGYTKTIRPPLSVTGPFKRKVMAAYHMVQPASALELDHLVPLEVGGANDAGNLWPEINDHPAAGVLNSKDLVENAVHAAVCAHKVQLVAAQTAIATDWTTALATLGLPPVKP